MLYRDFFYHSKVISFVNMNYQLPEREMCDLGEHLGECLTHEERSVS